jgi:hypothetical protein
MGVAAWTDLFVVFALAPMQLCSNRFGGSGCQGTALRSAVPHTVEFYSLTPHPHFAPVRLYPKKSGEEKVTQSHHVGASLQATRPV